MFKKIILAAALLAFALAHGGCQTTKVMAVNLEEASIREAVTVADPEAAVNEIYKSLEDYEAVNLDFTQIRKTLSLSQSQVTEYFGKISSEDSGLADVIILMPGEGAAEDVRLALGKYRERRIAEFENYDILDSYAIAQNAVIYDQGDFIILLMLADNDAARAIIDKHIPL